DPAAWCDAVAASESGRLGAHVHAYALVELGRVLLGAGDRPAAAQALERAERFCREKGFVRQLRLAAALSTDAGLAPARRRSTRHSPDLTGREKQVLALVAQGLTNRQIGERLFISDKTASVHVSAILRKLGVSSRT